MNRVRTLALGAMAGLAGTIAALGLLAVNQRLAPGTMPPLRRDPGEFMVERAERLVPREAQARIPELLEAAAARALALAYGITFGVLYAALRPRAGSRTLHGVALGLGTWAVGYLGWLWLLGLMPPVWRQRLPQAVLPAAQHVGYGLATVGAYEWLQQRH
ncbi:MAG: hypothetical protein ACE147_19560 [Candidatus Methylomirabilales bacterium]